ncbi:MarR family transcriptional regulator [Pseudosulfitobacter sp. SM2401]|uniref:MarR family winged helix-turn-helix transcriptional regulator n=1 Tax=Pseudosulfitobacter sp. SM2401 TaxID=3350098 RepID=UPI0036F1FEC2
MPENNPFPLFEIFNEIGIIEQLSRARLEARLPDGMIAPHFSVLNHLIRVGDGPTPIKLARAFQVPKTSMTHTLKMLEKRGMVETRSNPDDGRSKQVWLTPKGRETRDQTIAALAQDFSELAQGIDMEALIAIQPALTGLRKHLDASRDKS